MAPVAETDGAESKAPEIIAVGASPACAQRGMLSTRCWWRTATSVRGWARKSPGCST